MTTSDLLILEVPFKKNNGHLMFIDHLVSSSSKCHRDWESAFVRPILSISKDSKVLKRRQSVTKNSLITTTILKRLIGFYKAPRERTIASKYQVTSPKKPRKGHKNFMSTFQMLLNHPGKL